jgi:hypothetical protein
MEMRCPLYAAARIFRRFRPGRCRTSTRPANVNTVMHPGKYYQTNGSLATHMHGQRFCLACHLPYGPNCGGPVAPP